MAYAARHAALRRACGSSAVRKRHSSADGPHALVFTAQRSRAGESPDASMQP